MEVRAFVNGVNRPLCEQRRLNCPLSEPRLLVGDRIFSAAFLGPALAPDRSGQAYCGRYCMSVGSCQSPVWIERASEGSISKLLLQFWEIFISNRTSQPPLASSFAVQITDYLALSRPQPRLGRRYRAIRRREIGQLIVIRAC